MDSHLPCPYLDLIAAPVIGFFSRIHFLAPNSRDGAKSHEDGKKQDLHVSIGIREL